MFFVAIACTSTTPPATPPETGEPEDTDDTDDTATDDTGDEPEEVLLDQGFEAGLTRAMGCGDTNLYAWDPIEDVGLLFGVADLVADAAGPVDRTLDIPREAWLAVEIATPISANWCTDDFDEREVFAQYGAISGTARVVVDAVPPGTYATYADLTLTDVVLEDADGHTVTVPTFTITDTSLLLVWGG